jgi:hypothetical protein
MEEAMPFPRPTDANVTPATLASIGREQRISSDSHMTEPPDLWEQRLPPRSGTAPLRSIARATPPAGRCAAGGWDPYERLKDQAYDRISAEVLYPTLGTPGG